MSNSGAPHFISLMKYVYSYWEYINAKVLVNVVDITIDSAEWVSHQQRFFDKSNAQLGTNGIDDPM